MPTINLQYVESTAKAGMAVRAQASKTSTATATVTDRYHYATVNGRARTFERVGTDASGNATFRDQSRD